MKLGANLPICGEFQLQKSVTDSGKHKASIQFQNGHLGGLTGIFGSLLVKNCLPGRAKLAAALLLPPLGAICFKSLCGRDVTHVAKFQYFTRGDNSVSK
ncbi:hypothetical protein [Candidatus Sororendozoicomonas aggregata]|uniref:hypothetical protein n=1 Tax=Candidatus Sororendozoicomonas aggregata TaxID=3073239 RepID=UPI002ED623DE